MKFFFFSTSVNVINKWMFSTMQRFSESAQVSEDVVRWLYRSSVNWSYILQVQHILTYLQGQTGGVESAEISDVSQYLFWIILYPKVTHHQFLFSYFLSCLDRDFRELESDLNMKLYRTLSDSSCWHSGRFHLVFVTQMLSLLHQGLHIDIFVPFCCICMMR